MAFTLTQRVRHRASDSLSKRRNVFLFNFVVLVAVLQFNSLNCITSAGPDDNQNADNPTRIPPLESIYTLPTIPKQIWMFWDRGFDHPSAEKEAKTSLLSWQLLNPGWKIRALNMSEAEKLTNRQHYINDKVWKPLTMASKGDVYRILLLHKYGGVWADASCMCSVPLDSWLTLQQRDLYTFMRFDNLQQQQGMNLNPWFTSWFLASPPQSYTLTKLKGMIVGPDHPELFNSEYFWLHRSFAKLGASDNQIRRNANRFPSADAAHCLTRGWWETAPVFKRCANDIFKEHLIPNHLKCCKDGINVYKNNLNASGVIPEKCNTWDCTTLGPNYQLPMAKEHHDSRLRNIYRHQPDFNKE